MTSNNKQTKNCIRIWERMTCTTHLLLLEYEIELNGTAARRQLKKPVKLYFCKRFALYICNNSNDILNKYDRDFSFCISRYCVWECIALWHLFWMKMKCGRLFGALLSLIAFYSNFPSLIFSVFLSQFIDHSFSFSSFLCFSLPFSLCTSLSISFLPASASVFRHSQIVKAFQKLVIVLHKLFI